MADLIIKNMDMPEKCADCPLWRADGEFCCIPNVPFEINPYGERKLDDCPLRYPKMKKFKVWGVNDG